MEARWCFELNANMLMFTILSILVGMLKVLDKLYFLTIKTALEEKSEGEPKLLGFVLWDIMNVLLLNVI